MRSRPHLGAGRASLAILATTASSLVVLAPAAQAAPGDKGGAPAQPVQPVMACADLQGSAFSLPNTTVTETEPVAATDTTPAHCLVTLTVSDPEDGGVVTVWVGLPETTWNGRYQATGGSGFTGGNPGNLGAALAKGYAASATDAGNPLGTDTDRTNDGLFGLHPDGTVNRAGREDFGHEGVHDMAVASKAVISAYYGQAPAYSYWNGCSTGGRQGLVEAQKYPDDFDGIAAGAPVINYGELQIAQLWGQIVMLQEDNPLHPCKLQTAVIAAVAACDTVGDGVVDGVIGDPLACDFDPGSLLGHETACGVFTEADVNVLRRISEGVRGTEGQFKWYGLVPGAPLEGLNGSTVEPDGSLVQNPFVYDIWWLRYFLTNDADFDWRTLDYESFVHWFDESVRQYDDLFGGTDADLSAFHASGGKLVMWHGAADFGVMVQGSMDYYERLEDELGPGRTQQFARLFVAPGVGHCRGGLGAAPVDPLAAVVEWVENGKAPRTLDGVTSTGATRPICEYPFVAQWTGRGDSTDGSTYRCVPGTELDPREA